MRKSSKLIGIRAREIATTHDIERTRPLNMPHKSIPKQPPAPRDLLPRWRALSLLERLMLGPHPVREEILFKHYGDGRIYAEWYDYAGTATWLVHADGASLYFGTTPGAPDEQLAPEIERIARVAIKKLPKSVGSLVPPLRRNSMGWTFAMWTSSLEGRWLDLTGYDEQCVKPVFPGSEALYGSVAAARAWVMEQFEWSDSEKAVEAILRNVPLSRVLAKAVMADFDAVAAREAARERGYPLAEDLLVE